MRTNLLVYDGDCRFCMRCVRLIDRWDRHHRVEKRPFQAEGLLEELADLQRSEAEEAMQFYDAGGRRWAGAAAFRELSRLMPLGGPVAFVFGLPVVRWLADRAYRLIARNRHRLGCGSESCSL